MGTFLTPTGTFLTPQGTYQEGLCCVVSLQHPGELATKVRYFGVKSTNGCRAQMGTKPAKVTHRPSWPTKAAIKRITRCKNLYPVYPVYMSSSRLRHLAQTLVIMINL